MSDNKKSRRKKLLKILVRIVCVVILWNIISSSYAICNWWLPLISASGNISIAADVANVRLFSFSGDNLVFKNLAFSDARSTFNAQSASGRAALFKIPFGIIEADNVKFSKSILYTAQRDHKAIRSFSPENLRIGSFSAEDFTISSGPSTLKFESIAGTSFSPDSEGKIHVQASLAWDIPGPDDGIITFEGDASYRRVKRFLPEEASLKGLINVIDAQYQSVEFDGSKFDFSLETVIEDNFFVFKRFLVVQKNISAGTDALLDASGKINHADSTFSFIANGSADVMERNLIRFSPDLVLHGLDATYKIKLEKTSDSYTLESDISAHLPELSYAGKSFMHDFTLDARTFFAYDRKTKNVSLEELKFNLLHKDRQVASVSNEGVFTFAEIDDSYTVISKEAGLCMTLNQFPLSELNSVLPFEAKEGTVDLKYTLKANKERNSLSGKLNMAFNDITLLLAETPLAGPFSISLDASSETQGLENITTFNVNDFSFDLTTSDNQECIKTKLDGSYDLQTKILSLDGHFTTFPFKILSLGNGKIPSEISSFLITLGVPDPQKNDFDVSLTWNLADGRMTYKTKGYSDAPQYKLAFEGGMRLTPRQQSFSVSNGKLESEKGLSISFSSSGAFPDNKITTTLQLNTLTPEIVRSVITSMKTDRVMVNSIAELFYAQHISGAITTELNPVTDIINIPELTLSIRCDDASELRFELEKPLLGNVRKREFQDTDFSLLIDNLPLEWLNIVLPKKEVFKFSNGRASGYIKGTFKDNFVLVDMSNEITCENFEFKIRDTRHQFYACSLSGKTSFSETFSFYNLYNVKTVSRRGTETGLEFTTNAKLAQRSTRDAAFSFDIERIGRPVLAGIHPRLDVSLPLHALEGKGTAKLDCKNYYKETSFNIELAIDKAVPIFANEDKRQPPELTGTIGIDFFTIKDLVKFGKKTYADLKNKIDGKSVFNISFEGDFSRKYPNESAVCAIKSSFIDAELMRLIFEGARKIENEKIIPPEAVVIISEPAAVPDVEAEKTTISEETTAEQTITIAETSESSNPPSPPADTAVKSKYSTPSKWPIKREPGKIDLRGFNAMLSCDFKKIQYTDDLNFSFSGEMTFIDNIFRTKELAGKLNDSEIELDFNIDVSPDDGYVYACAFDLSNLEIAPLVKTFFTKSAPKIEIKGQLDKIDILLEGKGLSADALDENLKGTIFLSTGAVSVPLTDKNSFSLLRILMLPLEIMPRLTDIIPEKTMRDFLREHMGDQVDILAGNKNIDFTSGVLKARVAGSDMLIDKMVIKGPVIRSKTIGSKAKINPLHDTINLNTLTSFAGLRYPLSLSGKLSDPSVDYPTFVVRFLAGNTLNITRGLIDTVTLGLTSDDEEWSTD